MNCWPRLRYCLLVFAFVCGQMLMLAHAAGHDDGDEPAHVCLLCLAGHDLGSAAPPATAKVCTAACLAAAAPVAEPTAVAGGPSGAPLARGPPHS